MDVGEYIRRKQRNSGVNDMNRSEPKGENKQNMNPEEFLNRYSGMSEEQLMQELFKVGSVSNGNVTAKELDDFYNNVKGVLSPEQAEKMRYLIMQLKMQ